MIREKQPQSPPRSEKGKVRKQLCDLGVVAFYLKSCGTMALPSSAFLAKRLTKP
jgi:hypothetical protein